MLTALGWLVLAGVEIANLRASFEPDARIVHRVLSQRAGQHDAILATLALLQPADAAGRAEQRLPALYPQILSVRRRPPEAAWEDPVLGAAEARSRQLRRPELADFDFAAGRYRVVLAAEPASFAATFDLQRVVPWDEWPMAAATSPVAVALEQGGQRYVLQSGADRAAPWHFTFRKRLATESQPFEVVARRGVGAAALPWQWMLAWAVLAGIAVGAGQWLRLQKAQRQRAEELLRLGQVARLNTLGELAAGMAHELNQPLAALLASTQAARRLIRRGSAGAMRLIASVLAVSFAVAGAAHAQGVRSERAMSLPLASQIAAEAVSACAANGYAVSAAVVDRAGVVRALLRADNAGAHTIGASQQKAWTSASAKNTTLAMMEGSQKNPAAANLGDIPGFLLLGGGVPIKVGNETIGAVGVGGAPGGHLDEQCAVAALEKVKGQLQ